MNKYTVLFLLFTLSFTSFSQSSLIMENKTKYGSSIIKPTWENLRRLLICDMNTFNVTMKKYNYVVAEKANSYIADTDSNTPYFSIIKNRDDVVMIFEDRGYAPAFRSEIKKLVGNEPAKYKGNFEVYYLSFDYNGYKYKVEVKIKENSDGSCTIGLIEY